MNSMHKIKNLAELKAEIARVELLKIEQERYLVDQYTLLKHKIEAPRRFFGAITSAIPGGNVVKNVVSAVGKASRSEGGDWLTRVLQIGTPFVLNSTVLRNAGWLKKALVMLASETAIGQVNQDKVSGFVSKLSNFIRPGRRKKKQKKDIPAVIEDESPDFGLPPNSETY